MSKPTDIRVIGISLYFLPVATRVPLKFGSETLTAVTCARCCMTIRNRAGRKFSGWGETPLSVQWVWPSASAYADRHEALKQLCVALADAWPELDIWGHAIELGHTFQEQFLPKVLQQSNGSADKPGSPEQIPWLAALVCCSVFDQALHDAFGHACALPVYQTYCTDFMTADLGQFLQPASGTSVNFKGKHPADFLSFHPVNRLRAWHLVGGLDPLVASDLTGQEPADGYPVLLEDWIERDGLKCLKIKLRGNDAPWDYARILEVGTIAMERDVEWLSVDFNCTVEEPDYVNDILDRLCRESPRIYGMILYVEQPFPYDLERYGIDVHSVSARKPLFLDESAHDWTLIRLGRELGWSGVALKTCKTQTGAVLGACWARAHGMPLMVQDLTNPMLAQVPHLLLAAHCGTIMGVETNSMQFYPEASRAEAVVHPGIYQRRGGMVDLSTLRGNGFGYRLDEMDRVLPEPARCVGGD